MIIKVSIGKTFRGCINYVLGKVGAAVLDFSGVRGFDKNLMTQDFIAVQNLRPKLGNAVWHSSISFAYGDPVDDSLMIKIGLDYLNEMGLDTHQYLIVKHTDKEYQHFHIVSNRIGFDGDAVNDQWCKNKSARASDKLEVKYNLTVARNVRERKALPLDFRLEKKVIKNFIRTAIDTSLRKGSMTIERFEQNLKTHGVEMVLNRQSTGRVAGISFKAKGLAVKGSSIHRDYSYKNLSAKFEHENKQKIRL
jgi:hypothetical protein